MKRIIAVLAIVGLGLAGFAGACNLLNFSLTQVGANDIYGAQLQNNTGTNFLAHSFKTGFVDANGNLVDSRTGVSGCLRSWQNGASDYFSVTSTVGAATTANAIGALDLGSPLIVGNTISTSSALSNVKASTPALSAVGQTSATVSMTVSGTLKNNDSTTYAAPNICAVVFNNNNQVVLTQKQTFGDLGTGASTNFSMSVTVPNSSTSVSSVVVWADGLENNVPTTPISSSAPLNTGAAKVAFTTQPPTGTTGGAPFPVTVALQDASSNTITTGAGSTAQVTLSLSGGTSGAALTCDQASNTMAGVAGVAAFTNCKIDKVGTGYVITASSPGATSIASNAVGITLGGAAKVGFTTQPPASIASNAPFGFVAAIEDAGGNTVSTSSAAIAVDGLFNDPAGGSVVGCSGTATSSGVSTFTGCTIAKAGSGYTIELSSGGLTKAVSTAVTVTPASATQLAFTTAPSSSTATGVVFATQPVVAVEDAQNNIVTSNAAAITLTYDGAGLTCTTNPVTAASGVATFAGCKITGASSGNISATSPGLAPAPNVAVTITP